MEYFKNITDINELRTTYRQLALIYHPDKNHSEDTTEVFKQINNEYDKMITMLVSENDSYIKFTFVKEIELKEKIDKLVQYKNIIIEICGCWLWIDGNTKPIKEDLKEMGFKFASKKVKWYYTPYPSKAKRRKPLSMNKIRNNYGSEIIETKKDKQITY